MFHHFGWKLPIQGQIFRVFGGEYGSDFNFSFYNPQKSTSLRDSFEPLRVKIRPGVSSLRWSDKKINKKVTQKVIIHPFPRSPPWTDFYQIWNKRSPRGHNQS